MLALIPLVVSAVFAQTGEFEEPWKDERVAIVIDPFQGNSIDWEQLAGDQRVAGIIHRATIGGRKDTGYAERREEAKRRGYKWGSYHLGKPGDPIGQADFYLDTVRPAEDEVIALDIESLNPATDMSLANAIRFIQRIKEKTGRYPVLYANHAVVKEISNRYPGDSLFSKTPLWYARFKSRVTDFPTKTWNAYTLWQFSSEINCQPTHPEKCLYRVPGTQTDMDINVYRGTVEELKANWPFGREP
jgi:GH25 family lysozyme M1 (1,4-beta-N-acetylmuramidase)